MAVDDVQQNSSQYKTWKSEYTNEYGQQVKELIVKNRADGSVVKKSVWVDKDNSGTFDKGELTSVTIFGYTNDGRYATSRTFKDDDGDGYYDSRIEIKYYKKQNNSEYKLDYEKTMSDVSIGDIEREYSNESKFSKEFRENRQKIKQEELNRINIENKNENYKKESDFLSDILRVEAYHRDEYGSW